MSVISLWIINLDLRKTFDRINFEPLFNALRKQKLPETYIQLLSALYENNKGVLMGIIYFQLNVEWNKATSY